MIYIMYGNHPSKSGYGPVSLIRDRTVTVIDEMNDLGETLLVRAILITGEAVAHGRLVIQVIGRFAGSGLFAGITVWHNDKHWLYLASAIKLSMIRAVRPSSSQAFSSPPLPCNRYRTG